jgi:putative ubiquitin-RnfH superfamily antitoxin RatB of RatAB toxin-antitoxin module
MRIVVVYAAPGVESRVDLTLAAGAVVADAVAASGLIARLGLAASDLAYAIFGQRARLDTPLADGDRVELLRPLIADPKDLRRNRARRAAGTARTPETK